MAFIITRPSFIFHMIDFLVGLFHLNISLYSITLFLMKYWQKRIIKQSICQFFSQYSPFQSINFLIFCKKRTIGLYLFFTVSIFSLTIFISYPFNSIILTFYFLIRDAWSISFLWHRHTIRCSICQFFSQHSPL